MAAFSIVNPVPFFRETTGLTLGFANVHGQATVQTQLIAKLTDGPVAKTKKFPEAVAFNAAIVGKQVQLGLVNAADPGVRYLPWREDWCYYMRMDDAARIAFTGPLTGCNIFVAGSDTNPWLFHTNSNANGDDIGANNAAKRKMVLDLIAAGGLGGDSAGATIRGALERQQYATRGYAGFVFGYRNGNRWEFYFYGNDASSLYVRRIF